VPAHYGSFYCYVSFEVLLKISLFKCYNNKKIIVLKATILKQLSRNKSQFRGKSYAGIFSYFRY